MRATELTFDANPPKWTSSKLAGQAGREEEMVSSNRYDVFSLEPWVAHLLPSSRKYSHYTRRI